MSLWEACVQNMFEDFFRSFSSCVTINGRYKVFICFELQARTHTIIFK
jgi:hypothetical protein